MTLACPQADRSVTALICTHYTAQDFHIGAGAACVRCSGLLAFR